MSSLIDRVAADLVAARKSQNKAATLVLGTILAEIKNREIELRRDLTEQDVVEVVQKSIKKRRESIEFYTKGGRDDLAAREREEATLLEQYLPAQVDPSEIRDAVRAAIAAGASNVGAIMGKVMPAFKGRAEGGTINAIVREELAAKG